ncbi:DUF5688 family protein [Acetatifactor aquisgranensis]|uniref:DUF5688 family protein n=1 Tax=Acetatifactor aquisgranensis TaxID=2941233 RepID=UPI00203DB45A|nr:DUF5688 family protein [Acetatifactor aquisgranensis]
MNINEFAEKICSAVKKELGAGYRVECKEVRKNNGVILHGLLVLGEDRNVAPTIYLDTFLEAYEAGAAFKSILQRLLEICREDMAKGTVDMEFFRSFEQVRDRICYRLIGRKGNEELLEDIPYIEFLDLAICFYYAYHGDALGDGTILIHNSHLDLWETCTAELFGLAKRNTQKLFPWVCSSLTEVLGEMAGQEISPEEATVQEEFLQEMPLQVLSNVKRTHGAICMLYPGVLEALAAKEGRNFYILPSSIHEVILLADTGAGSAGELRKMVAEVNSTQVAPEEVLSDSLYYFDSTDKRVKIIF